MKLAVSEVFYSIQGEGKTTGYPSVFVRLGGCNLMCGGMGTQFNNELHNGATWRCDTIEVWMKAQSKNITDILGDEEHTALTNGANMIITGGEPLMQQNGVELFIDYLKNLYPNPCTLTPFDFAYNTNAFNCSGFVRVHLLSFLPLAPIAMYLYSSHSFFQ